WRLLMPGEHTWRRPWPFLIQWETSDAQRLAWDGVGQHGNGARGIAGLRVAARDVPAPLGGYERQLGLQVHSARVALQRCPIEVVQTEHEDEGLMEVQLRVESMTSTHEWFAQRGISADQRALDAGLVFVA